MAAKQPSSGGLDLLIRAGKVLDYFGDDLFDVYEHVNVYLKHGFAFGDKM